MDRKSLEEVLNLINANESPSEQKVTEQPAPDAEGLVFEYGEKPTEQTSAQETVVNEDNSPETPSESKANVSEEPVLNTAEKSDDVESGDEKQGNEIGSAPDAQPVARPLSEAIQEEAGASSDGGAPSKIWSTYVPRFTEVSEKYRLKGDKRLREKIEGMKSAEADRETGTGEAVTEHIDTTDPTAEIEDESGEIPVIRPAREAVEEKVATLNVYKFSGEDDFVEEINGVTAEDEAKKIEELLAREVKSAPQIVEEPPVEETVEECAEEGFEETSTEATEEEPRELPAPDSDVISVVDYSDRATDDEEEDAPSGVGDSASLQKNNSGFIKFAEFTNPKERDGFKDKFLDSLMSIRIRFCATLVFVVALLVLEILSATGVLPYSVIPGVKHNFVISLVDYILAACAFVVALPEVVRALTYLGEKKFMPDMMQLVGFFVLTVYTIVVILTGESEYPLFGFLFALMSLASISAAKYRKKADFLAFKVISQNEEKQILDKRPTRELTMENLALDGVIDEYSSRIVRTFRTSFISDFFKNSADASNVPSSSLTVLIATLSTGTIAAITAFLLTKSVLSAFELFTLVFLLGTPLFSMLSNKVSFYQSQRAAVLEESAAVGEGAFYEFASTDVVAFDDTDIFGPEDVNLKRFMLYGDRDNMEKAMRQMCALFAVVGGPLDFMFTNAIDNRVRHKSATNTVIEDDGLSGDVMGHRISAGSREYMIRNGISIPEAAKSSDATIDTTKVLYAAEDGEVYAKFYIRYSFSEEFTSLLPELKEKGIVPLVYTRDPNITNELLDTLTAGADCMRVVKLYKPIPLDEKVYNRVSARMVTFGDKLNAIVVILLSKRYKAFSEKMRFTELCATFVGAFLAIVFSIIGIGPAAIFASVIWQIVWCVALHYMSANAFLKEEKNQNNEE